MKIIFTILTAAGIALFFIFSGKKVNAPADTVLIPAVFVNRTDSALHVVNGVYYYGGQLFSGVIKDVYENGKSHHETSFYNGREEGWTLMYYAGGLLAEKRYYHAGEKDSVHTGWWPNGKLRFEYHFNQGMYNGDYKEWFSSGQAYKHIHYTNGADDWGRGWRMGGRLFMNYTMLHGRRYGIVNSNLCYTLKNEKGEFAETKIVANNNDQLLSNGSKPR